MQSRSIRRSDHHLIVAHELMNTSSDQAQLANIASRAKSVLDVEKLEAVADRGYYSGGNLPPILLAVPMR